MNVHEWLEQVGKLDDLVNAKLEERSQLWALATKITPSMDGMPHGGGVSDKVGGVATKLADLARQTDGLIDKYVDYKQEVISALEKLPEREYKVLYRYYVRYMTLEQIAVDLCYSYRQVQRIKADGLRKLKDVVECHVVM